MFKNFIHSQLLKPIFLSPNRCETQINKDYKPSKHIFFYRSVKSPFHVCSKMIFATVYFSLLNEKNQF